MVRWVLFLSLALALPLAITSPAAAQLVDSVSHETALTHFRLGEELLHSEQFDGAVTEFQAAIKFDPLLTIAHYELGQTYMAMRRYNDAVRAYLACRDAFERISGLAARNDFAVDQRREEDIRTLKEELSELQSGQVNAGTSRELAIVRLENQITDLERARRDRGATFQAPPELSLALGSAYFRSGDLPEAERQWKAAIGANKRLGEAHNNLAALYAMTGRRTEAEEAVKQAEQSGFKVNPKLKSDIRALPRD
jgi:tetratricopeptide (TPR) repeat protein